MCSNGVRGDKKEKEKEEANREGFLPVIWHEIVEGHFGSYTFGGTCTQISWNELGKPSSCGIVNCRYFVVVSLILEWTIHGIAWYHRDRDNDFSSFIQMRGGLLGWGHHLFNYRYGITFSGKSMRIVMVMRKFCVIRCISLSFNFSVYAFWIAIRSKCNLLFHRCEELIDK